ncbi:lycopene cyclase domain-containing protein [Georgenia sp. SYP-B2076]|uniref:lycopene cyclase domain-containing protein n=1 Tax=Georgenia sp. SYP-B2076 TaxID=2495881 RepID=UPI000F8CEBB9|nr:lycopene cyclase domain-containing protein [Georgenia sp. SYP-B2076]
MSYLVLSLAFLVGAGAVALAGGRVARPGRRWWVASAVVAAGLLVLTVVFDSLMVAADLFRYEAAALTGLRVGLAPVEDLAWPLAAAAALPALWELLGAREKRRAARAGARHPGRPYAGEPHPGEPHPAARLADREGARDEH